ncbi:hypothetical protein AGDE_14643 [Angomonas deanei]|nr:hypothetical protein AGDE_14643 [Angomonas deanei]|eukprot:EPY20481.1 hypothetical protein AGDE_14643 [Angomonas deanei]
MELLDEFDDDDLVMGSPLPVKENSADAHQDNPSSVSDPFATGDIAADKNENSLSDSVPQRLRSGTIPYADRIQLLEAEKNKNKNSPPNTSQQAKENTSVESGPVTVQEGEEPPSEPPYTARPAYIRDNNNNNNNTETVTSPIGKLVLSDEDSFRANSNTENTPLTDNNNNNTNRNNREKSAIRLESEVRDLQLQLANEKSHNIEAQKKIILLTREVDVLRRENMALASAQGSNNTTVASRNNTVDQTGGVHSSKYVEELEQRVGQLSRMLEQKQSELGEKEERVRLLEHRLADELINRGPSRSAAPVEVAPTSASGTTLTRISSVPSPQQSPARSVETRTSDLHDIPQQPPSSSRERSGDRVVRRRASGVISPQRTSMTAVNTTNNRKGSVRGSRGSVSSRAGSVSEKPRPSSARHTAQTPTRPSVVKRKGSTDSLLSSTPASTTKRGSHPVSLSQQRSMVGSSINPTPSRKDSVSSAKSAVINHNRYNVSPTRSHTPSMSSSRSRPQISYTEDTMTMKGTTTTVVFRSRSPQQYGLQD